MTSPAPIYPRIKPEIRHAKRGAILQKLTSPNTNWVAARRTAKVLETGRYAHDRWIIAIYAKLVGWTDLKALRKPPPPPDAEEVERRDQNVERVLTLYNSLVFGDVWIADVDRVESLVQVLRDLYVEPEAFTASQKESLDYVIPELTSADSIAKLRAASALSEWFSSHGLPAMFLVLSGLQGLLRTPISSEDHVRSIARAEVLEWLEDQKSYMDT